MNYTQLEQDIATVQAMDIQHRNGYHMSAADRDQLRAAVERINALERDIAGPDAPKNYHLIEARYLGPTNSRGSRVKLVSERFEQSVTIPYNYEFNNARDIAIDWLESNGHNVVGSGTVGSHYVIVVDATDHEFKPLKEAK